MAKSTGPVLLAGSLTLANQVIFSPEPNQSTLDTVVRIGVATGIVAAAMAGIEKVAPPIAVSIAWVGLVTVLFVRIDNKPTPLERLTDIVA
jgi:hypothetical protein